MAQKLRLPEINGREKEKSYKKDVDKLGLPNYSDVNKDLSALSPEQRAIVEALREGERLVDDLIAETNLPAGKVSSLLTMLAIRGYVEKRPGNRVRLK